tara:strand:+ start:1624 stop:1884 length:261 start_codon:yes stop_codon:yes gene_type:complete
MSEVETPTKGRTVFRKNNREYFVIAKNEYQGRVFVDIRSHYVNDDGDLAPTKKGITLPPDKLVNFISSLSAFVKDMELREEEKETD